MRNTPDVNFVNGVLGGGVLNGVVNLQLGVCLFDAVDAQGVVLAELTPAVLLRMDVPCAHNLYEYLGRVLASIEAVPSPANEIEQQPPMPTEAPAKIKERKSH